MPGPDLPQAPPPDVPEEFAATYAEAYRRALESGEYDELDTGIHSVVVDPDEAARSGSDTPEIAPTGSGWPAARTPESFARLWSTPVLVGVLAVALIGAAYGIGRVLSDDDPGTTTSLPSGPPSATGRPDDKPQDLPTRTSKATPQDAYRGKVEPVVPERARASCRARASIDSAGQRVEYRATNTLDEDPSTAWRCNGSAVGETIRFRFDEDIEIVEVGLIPGYAKTDPTDGADRYAENNRISRVRWILADGVVVEQKVNPDPESRNVQTLRVPRTSTGEITVEILEVDDGRRNTTAISSVVFGRA